MTLFFSLEKLERISKGSDLAFLKNLETYFNIKCKGYPKYGNFKSLAGNAYLLNAQPLFNITIDPAYIVQYVRLAARRDYTHLALFNSISLDISFYPEIDFNKLRGNPLLTLKQNQLHFKFEDIYYGSKFH